MTIEKVISIAKYSPFILVIIFVYLFFDAKKDKNQLAGEVEVLEKTLIKTVSERDFAQDFAAKLQLAATETTEYYQDKEGKIVRDFTQRINMLKSALASKKDVPISAKDTVFIVEKNVTKDTFKTDDLELFYKIYHTGEIAKIDFDYTVKEKTRIERKIIYRDKPVLPPPAALKSFWMLGVTSGLNHPLYGLNLSYAYKEKFVFSGGMHFIEKKQVPTIGFGIIF